MFHLLQNDMILLLVSTSAIYLFGNLSRITVNILFVEMSLK